jgi:hypothetical protein
LRVRISRPLRSGARGRGFVATTGDRIRLPMNQALGIFDKTDQTVKCFFWVSPTRKLYDLFWAIHSTKEQNPPLGRRLWIPDLPFHGNPE